jgi:hypothetical protein
VFFEGFIEEYLLQNRGIKSGEQLCRNDEELERVFGVFELGEQLSCWSLVVPLL